MSSGLSSPTLTLTHCYVHYTCITVQSNGVCKRQAGAQSQPPKCQQRGVWQAPIGHVKATFLSSLPSARLSLQMATTSSMQLNATIFKSRREPTSPDVLVILTLIRLLVMP